MIVVEKQKINKLKFIQFSLTKFNFKFHGTITRRRNLIVVVVIDIRVLLLLIEVELLTESMQTHHCILNLLFK